jgi:8-oxo-dGTP pyrophosphatase MutT (NUDIX family)
LPAATVLLLRDGEQGLEVLMTRRSMSASFAPGAYVFPGGGIDASDAEIHHLVKRRPTQDDTRLTQAVAAIRESFEELGVLLATDREGRIAHHNAALERLTSSSPLGKTPIEQLFISLVGQKPRVRFSKQLGQPESIDRRDQKIGSNSMVQIRRCSSEAIQIASYKQVFLCIEPCSERFDRLIPRRIIRCSNGLNPAIRN